MSPAGASHLSRVVRDLVACGEKKPAPANFSQVRNERLNLLACQGGLPCVRRSAMRTAVLVFFYATIAASAAAAVAGELGAKQQAVVAMVERVQEKFKLEGFDAAVAAVNDKSTAEFHDGDLYPFIYDKDGVCLANGARPALVGKNLNSLKDQDGKYLIQEMHAIAYGSGSGWLTYKWPSPVTNKIEDRGAYIEKMGDYFVGVGYDR
jgi:cytochrome c